jgi:hypothetical protein
MKKSSSQNVIVLGLVGTAFILGHLLIFAFRAAILLSTAFLTASLLHHFFK